MSSSSDSVAAALRWAEAWKIGWENGDVDWIVALYADDCVFATGPFREPYRGRAGVREYVARVFSEEDDPRVWVSRPIVMGSRASISWWASLLEDGEPTTLAGTSVLEFDDEGLVTSQWDTWNAVDQRLDPPSTGPFSPAAPTSM